MRPRRSKSATFRHSVAVLAPLLAAAVLASARASLWDALDFIWFLLTFAAFAHWALCEHDSRPRSPELLGLVVVMALLFPIISADDDLLQFSLPNESQTAVSAPEKQKASHSFDRVQSPAIVSSLLFPALLCSIDLLPELAPAPPQAPAAYASGNHSPPLG